MLDITPHHLRFGINRNIVECKDERDRKPRRANTGINRNIVECKVLRIASVNRQISCINRNIVECKDHLGKRITGSQQVLIET